MSPPSGRPPKKNLRGKMYLFACSCGHQFESRRKEPCGMRRRGDGKTHVVTLVREVPE
jgi:hypothetical protein